jgi:hypothetical protein
MAVISVVVLFIVWRGLNKKPAGALSTPAGPTD